MHVLFRIIQYAFAILGLGSSINAAAWTLHVIIVRHYFIYMNIDLDSPPPTKKGNTLLIVIIAHS